MQFKLPVNYETLKPYQKKKVREQYMLQQRGKCMYCEEHLTKEPPEWVTNKKINWDLFPDGFLKHPVHLQHNHDTGMTEGAVHAYCNAVLWQYHGR